MKIWFRACLAGLICWLGWPAPLVASDLALVMAANDAGAATTADATGCVAPARTGDSQSLLDIQRQQRELLHEHQGKTIASISYKNANVFDESNTEEDNRLFRFLNRIHVHTLKEVIASQLLFDEDDKLSADAVTESERLLRSRNYLANAYIALSRICSDSVHLTVYTQDSWTTEPQISFGHTGGQTSAGFALSEGNFFGSGNSIAIGYSQDPDRSGISYYFSSPHFLNSRLTARLGYSDNSDGEDSIVDIAYPFYSLKTPIAFGFRSEQLTQLEPIRFKGDVIEEYRHSIEHHELYFGKALDIRSTHTHRLLVGVAEETDRFATTEVTLGPLPKNIDIFYPWLEYQFIENQFSVYRNIDQIQRTEDIAMGKKLILRVGHGSEYWNADDVTVYSGTYSDVLEASKRHIVRLAASVEGKHYAQSANAGSMVAGTEVSYYYLSDPRNRWYARLRYDIGEDLQAHEELTVGGTVGVRGYPLDYQRGDQRYILSLERRYFSESHLFNLFRVGGVAFFDAGRAWGSDRFNTSTEHLANVGLGLRISSSKARIGHVVHLDVAFPVTDRQEADSVQWLIKAEQTF
jgi:hypothetical protein